MLKFIRKKKFGALKMLLRSGKVLNSVVIKQENVPIKQEKGEFEKVSVKQEVLAKVKIEKITAGIKQEVKEEQENQPAEVKATKHFDNNNKPFWELGRNRRIFVSTYKGVEYVHIREFYSDESTGRQFKRKMKVEKLFKFS